MARGTLRRTVLLRPTGLGTSRMSRLQGIVTVIHTASASSDLAAIGLIRPDEAGVGAATIRLIVGIAVRRAGHGPIAFDWHGDDLSVMGGALIWLVTTNKGWAHLRGDCWNHDPDVRLPFRADLFSAQAIGSDAPDRVALRVYACGTDPNIHGPTHKISGTFEDGGVRLFGD